MSTKAPMQLVHDPIVDAIKDLETFRVAGPGNKSIRVAFAPFAGPRHRGSVIISPGRSEFIEKHATTASDLIARGFNVLIVDQRGQGWSDRLAANPMAGHMDSFVLAAEHLGLAIEAAGSRLTGPKILLGHSMGGNIGLTAALSGYLQGVDALAFSAPMWGLIVPPYAVAMAKFLVSIGQSESVAPTTPKVWAPAVFEGNQVTHCPLHFARNNALFLAEPALQIGGPTNGWLDGAFTNTATFTSERLAGLSLPTLVVSAEAESIVDNSAHVRIVGQLPHAVLRTVPGAKHEMLHELPHLRDQFWHHFDTWFESLALS
jgi:lysophospholipase